MEREQYSAKITGFKAQTKSIPQVLLILPLFKFQSSLTNSNKVLEMQSYI